MEEVPLYTLPGKGDVIEPWPTGLGSRGNSLRNSAALTARSANWSHASNIMYTATYYCYCNVFSGKYSTLIEAALRSSIAE